MMNELYELVLQVEGIELGLLDANSTLIWHSPRFRKALHLDDQEIVIHKPITDIIPEFVGYEDPIQALTQAPGEIIHLERVGRETQDGRLKYITLFLCAYKEGFLLTIRDDTPAGELEQKITQQRNDLGLLTRQLSLANEKMDELFRRFVPPAIVDEMMEDSGSTTPGGKRRTATILFADLRSFTDWAEDHPPEIVLAHLNAHMEKAIDVVLDAGGTINQFLGDGFITFFNAPQNQSAHADLALKCAQKIVDIPPIVGNVRFGIGINSGPVVAGNIGSLRVMNYTVIGNAVNIASRLEKLAGPGEIVFGEPTQLLLQNKYNDEPFGPVKLKGIRNPIQVYKIASNDS